MKEEIKIGTFMDLSGQLAPLCSPICHGMEAYFKMINAEGGIHGRKIKIIIEDDNGNPAKSVSVVKKLVEQDKVFAIVGAIGRGTLAVMNYLNNQKVPFVGPGIGSVSIASPPKEYVFAIQPNIFNEAQIMVKFAVQTLKAHSIAVFRTMDELGTEAIEGIKKGIQRFGGEVVVDISFPVTQTEFDNQTTELKQINPDVTIIYALYKTVAAILKSAKAKAVKSKFITTYTNAALEFISLLGASGEGLYISVWINLSKIDDPGTERFLKTVYDYFPDEPNFLYTSAGWIAAEVFVQGLKNAGNPPTPEGLVKALQSLKHWDGDLAKDITYSPQERAGKYSMYFLQISNGMYTTASDWISIYPD